MNQARYAELFRTESREQLAEIDGALLALESLLIATGADGAARADSGDEVSDAAVVAHIASLFRGTHTIKGMAGAMGYRAVEQIAHALEAMLEQVRSGELTADRVIVAALFDGTDALRTSLDRTSTTDVDLEPAERLMLDRLHALGAISSAKRDDNTIDQAEIFGALRMPDNAPGTSRADADVVDEAARVVQIRLTADCPLKGVRALLVLTRLRSLGVILALSPDQEQWQREEFDGVFAATIRCSATVETIETAVRGAGDVARVLVSNAPSGLAVRASAEPVRTVRMDVARLDTLLDLVGELVITRDRLLRATEFAVEHGADRALARVAQDTARLVTALQDEVLQVRMVPVAQVFDRFPRLVRDIARELGKDVHFTCEGREIELDRSLLDAIGEPIMHLLRNALDHGIEDADARRAAGKPATGELVLRAARDRSTVVIQVEDDGRGINRASVRARAEVQGLLQSAVRTIDGTDHARTPDHDDLLSDDELLQVLAHPGFSTARAVTSISGRGVGVDVVMTRVRALGGSLTVESMWGEGSAFTLRLPVSLAITRALLVQVDDAIYAIPAAHVVEVFEYVPPESIQQVAPEHLSWRDESLPMVRLRERFGCAAANAASETFVAIAESSGRRIAILVDALLSQQDIVVKPLDTVMGGTVHFSGATVLGDGTPSLIVDVGSLC